jgi:hypothetical protein
LVKRPIYTKYLFHRKTEDRLSYWLLNGDCFAGISAAKASINRPVKDKQTMRNLAIWKRDAAQGVVGRSLQSGTLAGIATALVAAIAGRRETGSYVAPLNATSHVIWGEIATQKNSASFKYTGTGFLLNHAATIFWAVFYEKFFGNRAAEKHGSSKVLQPILGAAAVTAGAYITDYYLVPQRFTPGFERRLSSKSLAAIYGGLALGFVAAELLRTTRRASTA